MLVNIARTSDELTKQPIPVVDQPYGSADGYDNYLLKSGKNETIHIGIDHMIDIPGSKWDQRPNSYIE